MDVETAQVVLLVITGAAGVLWLIGLRAILLSPRGDGPTTGEENVLAEDGPVRRADRVTGRVEIGGTADQLLARAASALAGDAALGPLKIVEQTDERIRFERLGPLAKSQPASRCYLRGELRITSAGHGRSQVEWTVELANMGVLLALAMTFQILGLCAIVGGYWLISTYVVSSPVPAIRWQTFQMLQVIHFLWPSLLFMGLSRRGRREVAARFEALASNLPYVGD